MKSVHDEDHIKVHCMIRLEEARAQGSAAEHTNTSAKSSATRIHFELDKIWVSKIIYEMVYMAQCI